jgi:hypothetical protein
VSLLRWTLVAVADPHAERAVLSDLRVVDRPLATRACTVCGVVTRGDSGRDGYASAYALYDHLPASGSARRRS